MTAQDIVANLKKGITLSMNNESVPQFLEWMAQEKPHLPDMTFAVQKFKERSHLIPVKIEQKTTNKS